MVNLLWCLWSTCQRGCVKRAALCGRAWLLPSHGHPPHTTLLQAQGMGYNRASPGWHSITPALESPHMPRPVSSMPSQELTGERRHTADRHNTPDPSKSPDSCTLCRTNISLPPHPTRSQRWRPGSPPTLLLFSRRPHGSSTCEPGLSAHPGSWNVAFLFRCITMQFSWGALRSKNQYYQKQLQWLMICTHTFC